MSNETPTADQLRKYAEHFGEKGEGFDSELNRVPRDKRRMVRFNRDACFAACTALYHLARVKDSLQK